MSRVFVRDRGGPWVPAASLSVDRRDSSTESEAVATGLWMYASLDLACSCTLARSVSDFHMQYAPIIWTAMAWKSLSIILPPARRSFASSDEGDDSVATGAIPCSLVFAFYNALRLVEILVVRSLLANVPIG